MSFESLALLPELEKLPTDDGALDLDHEGLLTRIIGMDRDHLCIEFAAAVETPLMALFNERNVDDIVSDAYTLAFSNSELSLHEHYQAMIERGDQSVNGFISNLKGKVAELKAVRVLEDQHPGFHCELAPDPTQQFYDIRCVGPEETEDLLYQIKARGLSSVPEVLDGIKDSPNILFGFTGELYDKILDNHPEHAAQMTHLGLNTVDLHEDVTENLNLLASNFGIDVPDALGKILPHAGEVVLGMKIIIDIVSTERDFKGVELQDRSRVHAMKALVLISRFGVSAVCVKLGGAVGTIATPGIGTVAGAIGGGAVAFYLARRLRPRMMDVAMHVAGVTKDDLFYLRNKLLVDGIGESLRQTTLTETVVAIQQSA